MRGAARYALAEAMEEEVRYLCGRKNKPVRGFYRRGGSSKGSFYIENRSEEIQRPRVRVKTAGDTEQEYRLQTYEAARDGTGLKEAIINALIAGVSTRKQRRVHMSTSRISKSFVRRLWQAKGVEFVEELRNRALDESGYVVLMIDGLFLCEDMSAVVAMGITEDGTKHMLDYEIDSSENTIVCKNLLERLVGRGFKPASRHLLAVLDGSKALKKALLSYFPEAVIQTCLVHVERTLAAKLARKYTGELARLFKRLREAAQLDAAQEAYETLSVFIKRRTAAGFESLLKAQPFMLTLLQLDVPDTLNKGLLSTNSIENSIRNMRALLGRVNRWRSDTPMANRWIACAMLEAEKGMRRIPGYKDMKKLKHALNRDLDPHGGHIPLKDIDSMHKAA